MKGILFKLILLFGLFATPFISNSQLYSYKGLTVITHDYGTEEHTTQNSSVEGFVHVIFEQNFATWSFNDLFTGEPISENMQIINAQITPSTRQFQAITDDYIIYECFIDLGQGTISFRKVQPQGMHNTSVKVQELIFDIVGITNNSPQKSYHETEEQWINRGKGRDEWPKWKKWKEKAKNRDD